MRLSSLGAIIVGGALLLVGHFGCGSAGGATIDDAPTVPGPGGNSAEGGSHAPTAGGNDPAAPKDSGASTPDGGSPDGGGPPAGGSRTIERVFGNGLAMAPFRPLNAFPMRVLVKSPSGPVAGEMVKWTYAGGLVRLVDAPGMQPQETLTLSTDASGYATAYVWGSLVAQPIEQSTVTATLGNGAKTDFLVSIVDGDLVHPPQALFPDPPTFSTISGKVGQTLPLAFTATATCLGTRCQGSPIKDVAVRVIAGTDVTNVGVGAPNLPYAECSPTEQLSNAQGQTKCDLHFLKPFTGQIAMLTGVGYYFQYYVEILP